MKHTLLLASLFLAANASAQSTTIVHLDGEKVVIPFTLIKEWIFIDGEINGTAGRWMFDTGAAKSVSMNSLKVDQDDGKVIRTGFVGSGQTFEVLEYPVVNQIKVGDHLFENVESVTGNSMDFMYGITTEILGLVGFDFFEGYDFKIDYTRRQLTFYKQSENSNWEHLRKEEQYVDSIEYFTRNLENIPMFEFQNNGIKYLGAFDTGGGRGSFEITDENFDKLQSNGTIEDFYETPSPLFSFVNFEITENLSLDLSGLVKLENSPAHKPLGSTEKNTMAFAYSFLSQFITLWDTKNKVIYLLEKN